MNGRNMISDRFALETPVAIDKKAGRDESEGRKSIVISNSNSNESFVSTSLNQENFGDWGSFTDSKKPISFSYHADKVADPFLEQKEEPINKNDEINNTNNNSTNTSGFTLIELNSSVPKLPVSKREIRKGNTTSEHAHQPTIIFQTPLEGEEGLQISPIGSPVTASMRSFSRLQGQRATESARFVKRSVSEIGSFSNIDLSEPRFDERSDPPSPSKRSLFSAQKGSEMSRSFSRRRRPFANRALLMQIGARRKSYRQLSMMEDDDPNANANANANANTPSSPWRKPYRKLNTMEDDDEDANANAPPSPSLHRPQPELETHSTPNPPPQPINFSSHEDDDFEGILPLKAEPKPLAVKKRSTSKDRIKKDGQRKISSKNQENTEMDDFVTSRHSYRSLGSSQDDAEMDDFVSSRPSRKSSITSSRRPRSRKASLHDSSRSYGSTQSRSSSQDGAEMDDFVSSRPSRKSSITSSRRAKSRKACLNDSYRSHGSTQSRSSGRSLRSNSEDYTDFTNLTEEQERGSLLADVRRMRSARRLLEGGVRRNRSTSRKRLTRSKSKKKTENEEETKNHTSRCKNRRSAARRASMTGGIVNTEKDFPKEKRRSSMGHLKSNASHRLKERTKRRASMDHFTPSSPSSATCSLSDHMKPKSRSDTFTTLSSKDMTLSTHMSEENSPFLTRIPFGEEETETTKDTQDSQELSNSFRSRQLSRKSSMGTSKEHPLSKGRRNGRSRSVMERERKRSSSKHRQQQDFEQPQDKRVTVAEILAVVASASKNASPNPRMRNSRSNSNFIDLTTKSAGSAMSSSQSDKSRKSRNDTRFQSIRKGKRVDHQPEDVPPESPRRTKDSPMVVGKESRHRWGGRRFSAR